MKAKRILEIMSGFAAPCEYGVTASDASLAANEIEAEMKEFIATEVERRIAEHQLCNPDEAEASMNEAIFLQEVATEVERRIKERFPKNKEEDAKIAHEWCTTSGKRLSPLVEVGIIAGINICRSRLTENKQEGGGE